jgi:hypothetical protein
MRHGKALLLTVALSGLGLLGVGRGEARADFVGNLGDLISSGGSFTVDDKSFDHFTYSALPTGTTPSASDIGVTGSVDLAGRPTLVFSGNFNASNGATPDFHIGFQVHELTPGAGITGVGLGAVSQFSGSNPTGSVGIIETITSNDPNFFQTLSTLESSPASILDHNRSSVTFAPQTDLQINKDVIPLPGANTTVALSDITQSFTQVPEPSSLVSGSIGLLMVGAGYVWRFRRKVSV